MLKLLAFLCCVSLTLNLSSSFAVKDEQKKIMDMVFKMSTRRILDTNTNAPVSKVICGCELSEKCSEKSEDKEDSSSKAVKILMEKAFKIKKHKQAKPIKANDESSSCKNDKTVLECKKEETLIILGAMIANKDKKVCPSKSSHIQSSVECSNVKKTTPILGKLCNGKEKCEFNIDTDFESVCECADQKYMNVTYICIPDSIAKEVNDKSIDYIDSVESVDEDETTPDTKEHKRSKRQFGMYGGGMYGGFGMYGGGMYGGFGLYGGLPLIDYYYYPFLDYYYGYYDPYFYDYYYGYDDYYYGDYYYDDFYYDDYYGYYDPYYYDSYYDWYY